MRRGLASLAVAVATSLYPAVVSAEDPDVSGDWAADGWLESAGGDPAAVGSADDLASDAPLPELSWTAHARVTAYAPGCGDSGRGTRSGTPTRWGVIATDRSRIPAWSLVEIEGFPGTVFRSEDTGSGVRGWHVDVWMPTCAQARRHGSPTRAIRVLRWGP